MVGAYLIGYLIGRGFIFAIVVLVLLFYAITALIEVIVTAHLSYRNRHPYNPANERRNTLIFWGSWASTIILAPLYVYLDSVFHFTK